MKLKSVLYAYLYNTMDTHGLEIFDTDSEYISRLLDLLAKDNICPFKNYSCEEHCKNIDRCSSNRDKDSLEVTCDKNGRDIWRSFISGNEKENKV
jgi:hypothetical protein